MADQTGEDAEVSLTGPAAEWLRGKAEDLGMAEDDLLKRLVAVFRTIDEDSGLPAFATEAEVDDLRARVDALDEDLDDKVADVRERVVQLKREADEKAPADHEHPAIERNVDAALETARDAEATVADLEDRVDGGFENYEEVLEYLTDETEELNGKVGTLAHVTADLRDGLEHLAAREERRSAADRLADEANRHGIREAECEECQSTVDVALLSGPACPFCDSTFVDVEPKSGFLGTSTLVVGDRPALEAPAVEDTTDVLADLAESEGSTEPPAPSIEETTNE